MKTNGLIAFWIGVVIVASGCAYESEEDLYMMDQCQDDLVTYSGQVIPILQNNCYGCHGQGVNTAGVTLEGYENVKRYVENGRLLGTVKHESGFAPMPQNASKLSDCQISQLETWIDDGAENN